ncbi:MAG: short chain dehydrogenase [Bacteroidetes bacterium GWF2_38_335]|nr:MAG: short chain dehydrogenase [Bacteroidetes bacterium GWF2_38_335]OFY79080.1 MAG: short chain dehydrogenase [Bacteroidetes bacterium RIFOXYA12_FULL_38_20]HBS86168.1 short chain dehydrogenase [Bacteroidales bacterium]
MKDKVIIITGASSGIGLACAKEFAQRGAKIVLSARRIEVLQEIKKNELDPNNFDSLIVQADVSVEQDCKNIIEKTVEKYGKVDVLINNAGISMRALFEDLDLDVIRRLMDTNFWGTVYCTKYALPHLLKTKGSLVAVSSIAGFSGLPGRTGYSASKFAIHGFMETLRIENLKKGLHVLIAAPGFTASNIRKTALSKDGSAQGETPRNEEKMMSSETVAKHMAKAIIKRKRTMVLTPIGKITVTLKKFFPKMLDKMTYNHMAKEPDSPLK